MGIWQTVAGPSRHALEVLAGRRVRVTATYVGVGTRSALGHSFPTVLVRNVLDAESGELLADHLWFNRGNIWRHAAPHRGDRVQFIARAVEYRTGCWGPNRLVRADNPPRVEYKLTPPEELTIIGHRQPWTAVPQRSASAIGAGQTRLGRGCTWKRHR